MIYSEQPAAVLTAVQLPGVSDDDHAASLTELRRLAQTLGLDVVATISQKRTALDKRTVLGRGKLAVLAALTGGSGVVLSAAPPRTDKARRRRSKAEAEERDEDGPDPGGDESESADEMETDNELPARRATVVVVDHDLSPSQARALERATDAQVLDRTGVIIEIFHRHAKSREARLEVEIARLSYLAPRLREAGAGADRQRGGIGGRGAGESVIELDRRKIRDRIAELRQELAAIRRDGDERRAHRGTQPRVALVGYTNAGKSSIMRGLTASDVLVGRPALCHRRHTVRASNPKPDPAF